MFFIQLMFEKSKIAVVLDVRYKYVVKECEKLKNQKPSLTVTADILSDDVSKQHHGIIMLRYYMQNKQWLRSINEQMTTRLIYLAQQTDYPQLIFQSASILTMMVRNKAIYISKALSIEALRLFAQMLDHEISDIAQSSIQGIMHLYAEYSLQKQFQDLQILPRILSVINGGNMTNKSKILFLTTFVKIEEMAFGKDQEFNNQIIRILCHVINNKEQFHKGIVHSCYFSLIDRCNSDMSIRVVDETGALPKLLTFLPSNNRRDMEGILAIFIHITKNSQYYTNRLIQLGLISKFDELSGLNNKQIIILALNISRWGLRQRSVLLDSTVLARLIIALDFTQYFQHLIDLPDLLASLIPLGNPQLLQKFYKMSNIVDFIVDQLDQQGPCDKKVQALAAVLQLGEKFKKQGKNVFLQRLREEENLQRLQKRCISRQEQDMNMILLKLSHFVEM